jgi:hypothetical protein
LVLAVLRCITLREVSNTLVLFQDVFLIAIRWNVCRAVKLPKQLIPPPLVLIAVSHLMNFLFGRWANRQTVKIQQWVSKFGKQVTGKQHKVYCERNS